MCVVLTGQIWQEFDVNDTTQIPSNLIWNNAPDYNWSAFWWGNAFFSPVEEVFYFHCVVITPWNVLVQASLWSELIFPDIHPLLFHPCLFRLCQGHGIFPWVFTDMIMGCWWAGPAVRWAASTNNTTRKILLDYFYSFSSSSTIHSHQFLY